MKIQLHKPHRCSTILAASAGAILLCAVHTTSAQMLGNIFAGTDTPGATSVSSSAALVAVGTDNTATIGPGFSTTVGLTAGVADTLTASLNPAAIMTNPPGRRGALTISETSAVGIGVADVGGHFSTDKVFTGVNLTASTPYAFVLTRLQATQLSLLSDLTVQLKLGGTTVVTSNLLALFGGTGSTTATLDFTTPANLNPAGPLEITIAGDTTAGLIGNPLVFSSATFNQVPEPGTWIMLGLGVVLLVTMQRVRQPVATH